MADYPRYCLVFDAEFDAIGTVKSARHLHVEQKESLCVPIFTSEEMAARFVACHQLVGITMLEIANDYDFLMLLGKWRSEGCERVGLDMFDEHIPVRFAPIERLTGEVRRSLGIGDTG